MAYSAHDRMGETIDEPSAEQMRALLNSLADSDDEHPDVALTHESGWSLAAFGSGLLVWENTEEDDEPQHMARVPVERMLTLWQALAAGDIETVNAQPWAPGYGSPMVERTGLWQWLRRLIGG